MGYDTQYELTIIATNRDWQIIEAYLKSLTGYDSYELSSIAHNEYYTGKWYRHNDDMIELSKLFPEAIFKLEGVGEEHPDIWQAFYKNGKYYKQEAQIIFKEFDEDKLKEENA